MEELFEQIIYQAIKKNVSDIHLQCTEKGVIKFRICGELLTYETYEKTNIIQLMNYIRFISKIDLNYYRKPQTGHYVYVLNNKKYNLRISSLIGKDMDSIVIRILNNHQKLSLENISKDIHVYQFLKQIVQKDSGLFVISGATGSGKSTTLYAILDAINKMYKKNIITLEDPIEINKDYCLQIEIDDRKGISYHESLKQILRHDPDVIMVGEVRDEKTAQLALTCALTGHLVLTTIHASNCINTIKRLENLNISSLDLEDVLLGIMTQKMRFNDKKEVFILSEYIDQKNLLKYFDRKKIDYYDFSKCCMHIKNVGVLNENKLLSFIDLTYFFFNQGYSLQETLDFCSLLNYEKEVKEIKNYLNQGLSLDEIFIMLPFPTLFKEYYSFFKNEFTLETALKKSIEICKKEMSIKYF